MVYIGIDPGFASGALSLISDNVSGGKVIYCEDFKFNSNKGKKEINFGELYKLLNHWRFRTILWTIEFQQARSNQACGTTFKTGGGYWGLHAIQQIIKVPIIIVTPKKWKKFYNLGDNKDDSRRLASQFYPNVDLSKVKDNHKAESLLLARLGMYHYGVLKK